MAKRLIVLSDGTGNSAGKLFKTNVWKLYEALDLSPSSDQIALYDDGVGSSRFKPWALFTGAFGYGLKRNVLRLYVFLSRHYATQLKSGGPPPEIYAFGFSRGAYTVRVLSGLVHHQGLLDIADESEMDRLAKWAYRAYRRKSYRAWLHISLARLLRDTALRIWQWRKRPYGPRIPIQESALHPPPADGPPVQDKPAVIPIRFIGVWDTVSAYGVPTEELRVAIDKVLFPLNFRSNKLVPNVQTARQALSIDDERHTFQPILWAAPGSSQDVEQVWFCGVHANVGGGYPDDSLSFTPLVWMTEAAADAGLRFDQTVRNAIRARATPYGKMYDSRAGLGVLYRYHPRELAPTAQGPLTVHESVVFRMATGFQGYAPIALPSEVCVIDKKGTRLEFKGFQDQAQNRTGRFARTADAVGETTYDRLAEMVRKLKVPDPKEVANVRAAMLRRRFSYFATLTPLLGLLFFPLLARIFADAPVALSGIWLQFSDFLQSVLPGYLNPWIDAFLQHPVWTGGLAVVAVVFWAYSRCLRVRIADRARAAWRMQGSRARGRNLLDYLTLPLLGSRLAYGLWRLSARVVFPTLVLVMGITFLAWAFDRTVYWAQSAGGYICEPSPNLTPVGDDWKHETFNSMARCAPTRFSLASGQRYQIKVTLPPQPRDWRDDELVADFGGIVFKDLAWPTKVMMNLGALIRRKPFTPWFQFIARIDTHGSEEFVLTPATRPEEENKGRVEGRQMTTTITPRTSGELFLFVNDAYTGLFPIAWLDAKAYAKQGFWGTHLYDNNVGTATVEIRRDTGQRP